MSVKNQRYQQQLEFSLGLLNKFEDYLTKLDQPNYLQLVEKGIFDFKFKIGSRRIILKYLIDPSKMLSYFETYEIITDLANYPNDKLDKLTELNFEAAEGYIVFNTTKEDTPPTIRALNIKLDATIVRNFPEDYIRQVEKFFNTI